MLFSKTHIADFLLSRMNQLELLITVRIKLVKSKSEKTSRKVQLKLMKSVCLLLCAFANYSVTKRHSQTIICKCVINFVITLRSIETYFFNKCSTAYVCSNNFQNYFKIFNNFLVVVQYTRNVLMWLHYAYKMCFFK